MVRTIAQLRETTDDALIQEHDKHALRTIVGTGYYADELDRRSRERSAEASRELAEAANKLAEKSHKLSVITMILSGLAAFGTLAALVVSIVAILKTG